ncbi:MAG: TetR/AcrR family transcriptional regulator [Alphaproteobacteria bacterium]
MPKIVAKKHTARRRLSPAQRRRQIVIAAVHYFADVGFDGGTRALAKKIGVTQPLIYRYFPSKEDLIREVYKEVYLRRWRPEWEDLISDRSIPLRERLIVFYERYMEAIFTPEWIRIYLFSGLRGIGINQWWISFIEDRVLRKIGAEIRHTYKLPDLNKTPIQKAELDLYWVLHGGIFYYGVRQHVYEMRPHLELASFIELSIDSLLTGLPSAISRIFDEANHSRYQLDTERPDSLLSDR